MAKIVFNTIYDHQHFEGVTHEEVSLVKASFLEDEKRLESLIRRNLQLGNALPIEERGLIFGEHMSPEEFTSYMDALVDFEYDFENLPLVTRERYGHSPLKLLQSIEKAKNDDFTMKELINYGIFREDEALSNARDSIESNLKSAAQPPEASKDGELQQQEGL